MFSIHFTSSILSFIGLGLTFWGALLLFIKPVRYVKSSLLHSTTLSMLTTLNQIITELNLKGKAIYLPPRRLEEIRGGKAFIPSEKENRTPLAEELTNERILHKNPNGILLTPPGVALANLFEDTLGTSFTKVELNYLQNNIQKLFIEELELAEDIEIEVASTKTKKNLTDPIYLIKNKKDKIYMKVTNPIYLNLCKDIRKLTNICNTTGCPFCSSIACAITRITGKPVIIEKTKSSENNKTIEIYYRVLEE
jgi:hypothetical protein